MNNSKYEAFVHAILNIQMKYISRFSMINIFDLNIAHAFALFYAQNNCICKNHFVCLLLYFLFRTKIYLYIFSTIVNYKVSCACKISDEKYGIILQN